MTNEYNFSEIEKKWQSYWEKKGLFKAEDFSKKPKKYILVEFPYPSGDGLHVGHCRSYTALDIIARKSRMEGHNVLFPMGWDAFGLPTENYALKTGKHPIEVTKKNTDTFRQQLKSLGFSFDWSREINTTDPHYYKWTQWIFLKLYEAGLAYKEKIAINWCPSCKIGLANEEVVEDKCERCDTGVEKREMEQWMLRITAYADKLLEGLEEVDFPTRVKDQQRNWIGRSEGIDITYDVTGAEEKITCFTTRPDTNFGATFIVLAPEHPFVQKIASGELETSNKQEVIEYIDSTSHKSDLERQEEGREKTGVFTGFSATNQLTGEEMPIWVSDFVLMNVGTGAVVGVPGHDLRDFEFAKKVSLPIKRVVVGADGDTSDITNEKQVQEETGHMINSGFLDDLEINEAKEKIKDYLEEKGWGKRAVSYRLRDWVFSRQHYWGEPIPVIHCDKCGLVPVPENNLPVELPKVEKYEPTDTGESPLANIDDWVNVKCPTCQGEAKRETDTMPNWAGSSWYYLRYADPSNDKDFVAKDLLKYWMPVDIYNGGMEHTTLHLLYSRFWHKFLFDQKLVPNSEPYQKRTSHGMVLGEGGVKMSKSRGNVISPDDVVKAHGADTLRLYEMFMGPFENAMPWSDTSLKGSSRFLVRVWSVLSKLMDNIVEKDSKEINIAMNAAIKRVSEGTEQFKFNTAVAGLMEFLNLIEKEPGVTKQLLDNYTLLLSPYAPHLAEELWEKLGHEQSLVNESWPKFDEEILKQGVVNIPVQVNGKLRGEIQATPNMTQEEAESTALKLENIAKFMEGKEVIKVIYIEERMLNFVVK